MKNNKIKISLLVIALVIFISIINIVFKKELATDEPQDDRDSQPVNKEDLIEIELDTTVYQNFFSELFTNDLTYSESRIIELIETASMSVNPKGEVEIPGSEDVKSFFDGSFEELLNLKQNNQKGKIGNLISTIPKSSFALQEATTLIENEQIKEDLSLFSDKLLEMDFSNISSLDDFIKVYGQYEEVQKNVLQIYYVIKEIEKEFTLKDDESLTTYEWEVAKLLENDTVINVSIYRIDDNNSFQTTRIDDVEIINKIITVPAEMELEEVEEQPIHPKLNFSLRTDNWRDINIILSDEDRLVIGVKYYEVKGENTLLHLIEEFDIGWKTVE